MCSNTSLSSSGGGGGCGGGDSGGYGVDSMYSKKSKRQRVPKRGPGVAELEKILREQEKITDLDKIKSDGLSLVPSLSASYQPQSPTTVPPPSNSLPKNFHFPPPDPNHLSPSVSSNTTFYGNGGCNNNNNNNKTPSAGGGGGGVVGNGSKTGGGGVYFGGSGIFMPENGMFPAVPDPNCDRSVVDVEAPLPRSNSGIPFSMHLSNGPHKLFPSPPMIQRSQCSPPSMISLFPHSAVSTSPTTSPGGLCHGIEPHSNQTSYYHYTSPWPEEEKMVGTKRPRPFSVEIPQIPSFRCPPIPSFSSQMNRIDSSLSCGSRSIINLDASEAVSRDGKVDSYLLPLPNFKKCNADYGAANSNFLLFGSPPIHPPPTHVPQQERSKFITFLPQEFKEDPDIEAQQRTGQCGSAQKRPFYSFLLPLEPMSKVDQNEKIETRADGIDLNLRL
ncbi:hypothetical protein Tsubulata_035971 [Turnera subulata]|uniref:Uncharacterized protein n=1 Tax=Turnera subulata TaxID=218843 RepID=A0A9Q0FDX6_9ROSI|nr:hypothetical protein Tsubulata_035971 [Turnera subulata]